MEIIGLDDAEMELTSVVAGIFPPLKKLGDSPEICFKVMLSFVGKVLCDSRFVAPWLLSSFQDLLFGDSQAVVVSGTAL